MESTYSRLGRVLLLQGNTQNTKKVINEGLRDYPNSMYLWLLKALLEQNQNHNEALSAAKKATYLFPSDETNYVYTQIQQGRQILINRTNEHIKWLFAP